MGREEKLAKEGQIADFRVKGDVYDPAYVKLFLIFYVGLLRESTLL